MYNDKYAKIYLCYKCKIFIVFILYINYAIIFFVNKTLSKSAQNKGDKSIN